MMRHEVTPGNMTRDLDNDVINELLRDNFGDTATDQGQLELDKNLSEILEDLKRSISEDIKNNNASVGTSSDVSSDSGGAQPPAKSQATAASAQSEVETQKDEETELEADRMESLRNPRFQTLPAFKKRAKQEAQWREAVSAARRARSLGQVQVAMSQQHRDGHSGAPVNIPITALSQPGYSNVLLPKPKPPEREDQLDLTSLDLPASVAQSRLDIVDSVHLYCTFIAGTMIATLLRLA